MIGQIASLLNAIRQAWRDRRVIRVTLGTAIPTLGAELGPSFMCVTVTNIGHRDVTVEYVGIRMPDARHFPGGLQIGARFGLPDTRLPARLADGDSAKAYFPYLGIAERLHELHPADQQVELTPACRDSSGGEHAGEPWKVTAGDLA